MTTTLITGGSGFVGSYVSELHGVVDLRLDEAAVDLRRAQDVHAAVARIRPDAVIHLAAQSSVALALKDPALTFEVNFHGTHNLLQALADVGFRGRLLYVSSGEVYGSVPEHQLPVEENAPLRPRNPYAVSKVAAEALCYQWSQTGPFEIVVARPFNHIGPRQGTAFAVADFARQIVAWRKGKGSGKIQVGDIEATRDFTDVRDIVFAYGELLSRGRNGEAYNVCSGVEYSLREIIEGLFETSGVRMPIEVDATRLRRSEQRRMSGSYDKLHQQTGWRPRLPLRQTLADIVAYWDAKEGS